MDWSFQLYSARNFQPWDKVLKMLGRLGYRRSKASAASMTTRPACAPSSTRTASPCRAGISRSTCWRTISTAPRKIAETLGIKLVACPHIAADERPTDAAGWRAFGERLGKVGEHAPRRPATTSPGTITISSSSRLPTARMPQNAHPRRGARHRLGDRRRLGDPRRRRSAEMDRPTTARASSPSTSRTSRRPARTPTRTAGPMSATARSTGPG